MRQLLDDGGPLLLVEHPGPADGQDAEVAEGEGNERDAVDGQGAHDADQGEQSEQDGIAEARVADLRTKRNSEGGEGVVEGGEDASNALRDANYRGQHARGGGWPGRDGRRY